MLTETASATTSEPAFTVDNFEVRDEDLPEFRDMKFEDINELHLDHPGAADPEYRKRRDHIARLAKKFRDTGVITDVDYNEDEQNIWRVVAKRLEEIQARRASTFYLQAKKDLGISNERIPQLTEIRMMSRASTSKPLP